MKFQNLRRIFKFEFPVHDENFFIYGTSMIKWFSSNTWRKKVTRGIHPGIEKTYHKAWRSFQALTSFQLFDCIYEAILKRFRSNYGAIMRKLSSFVIHNFYKVICCNLYFRFTHANSILLEISKETSTPGLVFRLAVFLLPLDNSIATFWYCSRNPHRFQLQWQ